VQLRLVEMFGSLAAPVKIVLIISVVFLATVSNDQSLLKFAA